MPAANASSPSPDHHSLKESHEPEILILLDDHPDSDIAPFLHSRFDYRVVRTFHGLANELSSLNESGQTPHIFVLDVMLEETSLLAFDIDEQVNPTNAGIDLYTKFLSKNYPNSTFVFFSCEPKIISFAAFRLRTQGHQFDFVNKDELMPYFSKENTQAHAGQLSDYAILWAGISDAFDMSPDESMLALGYDNGDSDVFNTAFKNRDTCLRIDTIAMLSLGLSVYYDNHSLSKLRDQSPEGQFERVIDLLCRGTIDDIRAFRSDLEFRLGVG